MMLSRSAVLLISCLLVGFLSGPSRAESSPKAAISPQTQEATPALPTLTKPEVVETPTIVPPVSSHQPKALPLPACCAQQTKSDESWNGKDIAALLSGIAGFLAAGVAALAIWWNGRTTRATTIQKANEAELATLDSKLDKFLWPLPSAFQHQPVDRNRAEEPPARSRHLLILLDPDWRNKFSKGDAALVDEIVSIDEALLKLKFRV